MSFVEFIQSPWGNLCIGVIAGIMGTAIYKMGEKIYKKADKKIKHRRFINKLVSIGEVFGSGYTTSYARANTIFHQLLHINDYVIRLLKEFLKIIIVAFSAVGLLFVFQEYIFVRPIIIAIACVVIAVQFQRVKKIVEIYNIMFDYVYGEEYKKHMMDGVEKYWDELTCKQSKEESDKE